MHFQIEILTEEDGKKPFIEWIENLQLKDQARINNRIARIQSGNFGDTKSVGDGVFELRFFFGSGFRVYYAKRNDKIVIILSGGDKSSQDKDIKKAKTLWNDYIAKD